MWSLNIYQECSGDRHCSSAADTVVRDAILGPPFWGSRAGVLETDKATKSDKLVSAVKERRGQQERISGDVRTP